MNQENQKKERTIESLAKSLLIRKKQNPHKFYIPNGKCEEFIEMVGHDKIFVSFFCAGNGVGKTALLANIVSEICFGRYDQGQFSNKWFDYPLFREPWKYPKKGRIVSDPTTVNTVTVSELKKWFPEREYYSEKRGKSYDSWWYCNGGHKFDIMTYEQDAKEFESATLGWAIFDEPPPEAIYKATVSRMRTGGVIMIFATPLIGSAWMYDHLFASPDRVRLEDMDKLKPGQRAIGVVEADIEDNCVEHGIRGILEHEHIVKMVNEYTEEEKLARASGKFQHLTGLVFKQFSRGIHVIKPFAINKEDYTVYQALDPHPRNPDACVWIAVDRKGTCFVIDELYLSGKTKELASRINAKDDRYRVVSRVIDPSAFNDDQHRDKEKTLACSLEDYGIHYEPASKKRTESDRKIRDAIEYEKKDGEMIFAPKLYFFDTCVRTIWEMEHYQWAEWTGKTKDKKSPSEKPMDKDDHCIECIGRILIQDPTFEEQIDDDSFEEVDDDIY